MREQEIVLEVAKGHSKQNDIARALHISLSTVNVHLWRIYRKTGTRNQIQLIRWAWREAAKCRQDENAETFGADNGNKSPTVQSRSTQKVEKFMEKYDQVRHLELPAFLGVIGGNPLYG